MTWVADTSWLYALVDDRDPHHLQARSKARQPEPVEVPETILAETLDLIRYRQGKQASKDALRGFERLPHFVLGAPIRLEEVAAVWRAEEALSFADSTAVAAALSRGRGLASFDRRQIRARQLARSR